MVFISVVVVVVVVLANVQSKEYNSNKRKLNQYIQNRVIIMAAAIIAAITAIVHAQQSK